MKLFVQKVILMLGCLQKKNDKQEPKRVLSRAWHDNDEGEYGAVEKLDWIRTGVFLTKDEWRKISYKKGTDEILNELGVKKQAPTVKRDITNMKVYELMTELSKYPAGAKVSFIDFSIEPRDY